MQLKTLQRLENLPVDILIQAQQNLEEGIILLRKVCWYFSSFFTEAQYCGVLVLQSIAQCHSTACCMTQYARKMYW